MRYSHHYIHIMRCMFFYETSILVRYEPALYSTHDWTRVLNTHIYIYYFVSTMVASLNLMYFHMVYIEKIQEAQFGRRTISWANIVGKRQTLDSHENLHHAA
ncbi:hypothetical protein ACJX0J_008116, partial [Zea mays]